jgi:predicted unusual protein kinase regulating ubiquinone biosynthesis (AarF/ABC1/UbiB family)
MPTPYLTELGKLQDSIPARPTAEVLRTIREELSPELAGEFGAGRFCQLSGGSSI